MEHRFVNVCLDCGWGASTDEYTRTELSDRTVEHAVDTGHDVTGERLRNGDGASAADRLRERKRAKEGRSEPESPKPDRENGDRQRVYRINDDFLDGFEDSSDGDSDESGDDVSNGRGRPDEPSGALTRGDFEAELRQLVRRAHRSGVPVEGCDVRFPAAEMPDYTIEIHELRDSS